MSALSNVPESEQKEMEKRLAFMAILFVTSAMFFIASVGVMGWLVGGWAIGLLSALAATALVAMLVCITDDIQTRLSVLLEY